MKIYISLFITSALSVSILAQSATNSSKNESSDKKIERQASKQAEKEAKRRSRKHPQGLLENAQKSLAEGTSQIPPENLVIIKAQRGDTISSIADSYGVSSNALAKLNNLKPNTILDTDTDIKILSADLKALFEKAEPILVESGKFFKEGLFNIQDNRRLQAGSNFNKAIDVFLMSGFNINHNIKLFYCYNQLIETVYRIEFPSNAQQPQIRSLSVACGWAIDNDLADKVARIVLTVPTEYPVNTSTDNNKQIKTTQGFNEQKFEVSPLDDLAKLELTPEEQKVENSQTRKTNYPRPSLTRTVKTRIGDTLARIAEREGVSVTELAKYNGLLPTSILSAGREIKIPSESSSILQSIKIKPQNLDIDIGVKPVQAKDGKVQIVMKFFNDNFNDPYSMRFVEWSKVERVRLADEPYWAVAVKFRAKNAFGAYILSSGIFYIRKNKIVKISGIN